MSVQQPAAPQAKSCFDIDLKAFENFRETVKKEPAKAAFTFKATTEWLGGARARTQARHFTIATDEPDALGGTDSAPDPVELVLAAATTCLQIGIVTQAARRGVELEDLKVEAEGDLDVRGYLGDESVRPGYQQIRYRVQIKGNAPAETLQEIVDVARRYSPMLDTVANGAPLHAEVQVQAASA